MYLIGNKSEPNNELKHAVRLVKFKRYKGQVRGSRQGPKTPSHDLPQIPQTRAKQFWAMVNETGKLELACFLKVVVGALRNLCFTNPGGKIWVYCIDEELLKSCCFIDLP